MIFIKICVILATVIPASICGGTVSKFGCTFLNDQYEVEESVINDWGYGTPVKTLALKNELELESLVNDTHKIRARVLQENIYNSVDDFLELYDDYFAVKGTVDFIDYFKEYIPKFRPHEDTIGTTIDLLDGMASQLSDKHKHIADNLFIAAVQYDMHSSLEQLITVDDEYIKSIVGERIPSVMGVLKFSLGEVEPRTGYLVLDAGYAITPEILIVMEDGKNPTEANEVLNKRILRNFQFDMHPSNKHFIIGKYLSETESYFNYYLIYVHFPYSLPRYIPQKFDLLKSERYMVKRSADNVAQGGFYFFTRSLRPQIYNRNSPLPSGYTFTAFAGMGDEKIVQEIKFDVLVGENATSFGNLNQEWKDVLTKVMSLLNISKDDFYLKLGKIYKLLRDQEFVAHWEYLEEDIYENSREILRLNNDPNYYFRSNEDNDDSAGIEDENEEQYEDENDEEN